MRPPKDIRNLPVCTITGTDFGEEINGTDNDQMVDKIDGTGGDDTLNGDGGVNGLIGGTGHDTITGGPNTDIIFANDAVEQTTTGDNAEITVNGTPEEDTIVSCGGGDDTVYKDNIDVLEPLARSDCEHVPDEDPNNADNAEPAIPVAHWYRRSGKKK